MDEIIYFEVNNWCPGETYPDEDPFLDWLSDDINQQFRDDAWAKENKICVSYCMVDMSFNYVVSAPRKWVEENCPCLLSDRWRNKFCFDPFKEEDDDDDREYMPYLEYKEENFGVTWNEW